MAKRTAMVTGANGGIGRETALGLAKLGFHVVCVCRDRARGEQLVAEVKAASGSDAVELGLCDLASQASIRDYARAFRADHDRLHVLVNNAGVVVPERHVTPDGYETTFALNHLGYFLLTHLLLDLLEASAPARIVNVSSHAQRMFGRIDFEDLMGEKTYKSMRAYSQSKLANVMFTYDLAKRLEGRGVTVNAIHPGPVATGFGSEYRGLMGLGMKVARRFMRTPEKGAETLIWAASSSDVDGVTGKYFFDKKAVDSVPFSYDEKARARLWNVSCDLTGIAAVSYGHAA
jgi:NAD(P)-dependent dehydrogenase (short-subunit alcohol dehydrogenase family)